MKRKIFFVLSLCLILCMGFLVTGCANGKDGTNGVDGKSAYQIWLDDGHTGTQTDFLNWLKGENGKSAYEIYIQYHPDYDRTEEEFLNDLANGDLATRDPENPQELSFTLLDDDTYAVSAGNAGKLSHIIIPDTYKGKSVTVVMDNAFKENQNIKSVVIGNNVTTIGQDAFKDCGHLLSVTLGTSVEKIGGYAFLNSKIAEVINKSNYKENGTTIMKGHYYGGYVAMNAVCVKSSGSTGIEYINGYAFLNYGGENYLLDYVGDGTNITLPANYNGENYKIRNYAFDNNLTLTSVTINNGVKSIGWTAFRNCTNLVNVYIYGTTTEEIGEMAFKDCTSLENVVIGAGVKVIEQWAFQNCTALESANFVNSNNWGVSDSNISYATNVDVSDNATAATMLKDTYCSYNFFRLDA